jgi:hypothetical protein
MIYLGTIFQQQSTVTSETPKEKSSPLDTLLENAFDQRSGMLEERNEEIRSLKAQLAQRPTVEAFKKLLQENAQIKSQLSGANFETELSYKTDRENMIAIFSHLQLPNLPLPVEANLSQYLATLRAILDRTSVSKSLSSPVTPYISEPK